MDARKKTQELASVRSGLERLVDRRLLQGFNERDAEVVQVPDSRVQTP